jgi:hypothetical protein
MKRHLLSVLAVAAVASIASAQQPTQPPTAQGDTAAHHAAATTTHKTTKHHMKHTASAKAHRATRHTSSSGGEVDLGGAGYSVHAVPRDFVTADNTAGDDLWRREQRMDARCGKNRERCGNPR